MSDEEKELPEPVESEGQVDSDSDEGNNEQNEIHDPQSYEEHVRAAERMLVVKKAKDDLIKFCQLLLPDPSEPDNAFKSRYDPQRHHECIALALQEVEKGNIPRLIITMPPRAGKSEISAKKFIPWVIGRDPYRSVIFATYNDRFAEDTGRSCRNAIKTPMYKQIFPQCKLRANSAASDRLETEEGGIAAFVGVGGSITGRGADFLVIDDPIKDREQADSRLEREKQWQWFTEVALTRLMDDMSRVVIIMTRWHEDDIVGRITDPKNEHYNEEEARKWKILALPAIAGDDDPIGRQPGESLWPKRFSIQFLHSQKALNSRGFSALYQGRPTPEDGEFFKKEHFMEYNMGELPENLRMYCASDHAVTIQQYSDYNVLLPVGIDVKNHIWIMPQIFWKKAQSDEVTEQMLNMIRLHKPIFWWAENGHISKSIGPFLRKRMMEESVHCAIVEMTPSKDKQQRAQSIQGRMAMGMVHWPRYAHWYQDAKDQMLKFPAGSKDDFVDALAWIGIGLNLQVNASLNQKKTDILPKEGSIGWILGQAKWEADQKKILQNTL